MVFITPLIIDGIGLRGTVTLCAFLSCACAALRCITDEAPYALYFAHSGQILNAIAGNRLTHFCHVSAHDGYRWRTQTIGPLATAAPSLLSATWFEPSVRTTATAVSTMAENLGAVIGFMAGLYVHSEADFDAFVRVEAIIAVIILTLAVSDHMFPAVPPLPPSASSAATQAEEGSGSRGMGPVLRDMWKLCKQPNFMLLMLMYAIGVGTVTAWSGIIDPILAPLGYTQVETGIIGAVALLSGLVGGLAFGLLADRMHGVKMILLALFIGGAAAFTWLAILTGGKANGDESFVSVLISSAIGMFCIIGSTALFYEESVESVFPIGNCPLVSSFISFINDINA
jgi:FLVCR family MFS transporter